MLQKVRDGMYGKEKGKTGKETLEIDRVKK